MKGNAGDARASRLALYDQFARIGRALASPQRIELIDLLDQAEKHVDQLSRETGIPLKSTSAHLRVLRAARLVETRRQGKYVLYRLADPQVSTLARSLVGVARARLAEVSQISTAFLERRDTLDPVGVRELRLLLRRAEVVLLDVRPADEYAAGHIAGARNIPLAELSKALARLPRSQEIIAYCRGPYCVMAPEAVALLRRRGRKARRLEIGFPEARDAGFPVATLSSRSRKTP